MTVLVEKTGEVIAGREKSNPMHNFIELFTMITCRLLQINQPWSTEYYGEKCQEMRAFRERKSQSWWRL